LNQLSTIIPHLQDVASCINLPNRAFFSEIYTYFSVIVENDEVTTMTTMIVSLSLYSIIHT
jgi:hypothetical protein